MAAIAGINLDIENSLSLDELSSDVFRRAADVNLSRTARSASEPLDLN
jgi:hypothetical protein